MKLSLKIFKKMSSKNSVENNLSPNRKPQSSNIAYTTSTPIKNREPVKNLLQMERTKLKCSETTATELELKVARYEKQLAKRIAWVKNLESEKLKLEQLLEAHNDSLMS